MYELLSPAGDMLCLDAAISAGADAVYLAGKSFGARAYAGNFSEDELITAAEKLHLRGKKLYVTLNTLITDRELASALEFVRFLWQNKVCDGIIVQDVGLIAAIKTYYPTVPLHGSTQMCIHGADGVNAAKALGLDRVVVARECSAEDIRACVEAGVEIEAFIHGAHCVSQSGGCLFSSFIGKRSGNRGQCAQPCRLPYKGGYCLSLKDMCLAEHIPALMDMGVASFKIEGRMKAPEYVYSVTKTYRELIDSHRAATKEEYEALKTVFSRSGFSDGYFIRHKGSHMFGVRSEKDKETTREMNISVPPVEDIGVDFAGSFTASGASLAAMGEGCVFTAECEVLPATGAGTTAEEIKTRISKTGGSGFKAESVNVSADEGIFLPASAVNSLRRNAIEGLKQEILKKNSPVASQSEIRPERLADTVQPVSGDIYRIFDVNTAFAPPSTACRVDIPLWQIELAWEKGLVSQNTSVCLPRVIFIHEQAEVKALLEKARGYGVTKATVSNIGHIALCKGFAVYGDWNLNITNSQAAKIYMYMGLSGVCVSPEVTPAAVEGYCTEYIAYGKQPLMHTENCIIKNIAGCTRGCRATLTDRTGTDFSVLGEYNHRNLIFNSVPTYLLDKSIPHSRVFLITDEKEIPSAKPEAFTRGYCKS